MSKLCVALLSLVALTGCSSGSAPDDRKDAPTSGASGAPGAEPVPGAPPTSTTPRATPVPSPGPAAPAPETFAGRYEVPVPPQLAAAATYPVGEITWRDVNGTATLEYDLPLALVGQKVRVSFIGAFDPQTNKGTLFGAAGTAECTKVGQVVSCLETMRGLLPLVIDTQVVASLASSYAGPVQHRLDVSARFSTDPIGIARVALDTPAATDDGGKAESRPED